MKKIKLGIAFLFVFYTITNIAQERLLKKSNKLSIESVYRSYGKGDQIGFGIGIEYSKNIKKWLELGLNLSYWSHSKKSWDFTNPFTGEQFIFNNSIKELRIHPFIQLIPLNTKYIDFYFQLGFSTGYFNHKYYLGYYNIEYNPQSFDYNILNKGYKGIYLGYDFGLSICFKFGKFIIIPNSIKSFNFQDRDGFDSLNLKLGYMF